MNTENNPKELISEIKKTLILLEKNRKFYENFQQKELPVLGKGTSSAMIISQIVIDFYTGIETIFHRISQFFGNSIDKNSWHKSLLKNMTLEIEDKRAAAINDTTASTLDELLRFRHFRRYYFDTEYDWERIEFIKKKYLQAADGIKKDLDNFIAFLEKLA